MVVANIFIKQTPAQIKFSAFARYFVFLIRGHLGWKKLRSKRKSLNENFASGKNETGHVKNDPSKVSEMFFCH